jgi:ribosomal protein S18 acetylase RimI-like enzyme
MTAKVRAFDGTRGDARGIIDVDVATFGDCRYSPQHVVDLESDPQQYAWVAEEAGQVVGFVSAFLTHSLAASRWEVDELAVHPAFQGRGLGTALVGRALAVGSRREDLSEARSLVAVNNAPSRRVFNSNGFGIAAEVRLLSHEIAGRAARPLRAGMLSVRRARPQDASGVAKLACCSEARAAACVRQPGNLYLLAGTEDDILGYAELIHVRTLQYEGLWIESIIVSDRGRATAVALFGGALEEARRREAMDRIGYLAPQDEHVLYDAAVGEGFTQVDKYLAYVREFHKR